MKLSIHQQVADRVASDVVATVSDFLCARKKKRKPATPGGVVPSEVLLELSELLPLARYEQRRKTHVEPVADAICTCIAMRGLPHSFVAPTWQREGATMLGDATVSTGVDGPVIRAVVFREADGRERLAVLYSPRFAAE